MTAAVSSIIAGRRTSRQSADQTRRRFCLHSGFTLIELVLILVIISIMGAIAMPKYASAANRYRADAAARRIAADIAYARSLAIATSSSTSIQFNCTTGTYQIAGATDPDHGGTFSVNLSAEPYSATLSSTAAVSGVVTLTFNGYAIPTSTPSIVITSNDATRTVTVNADAGTTTVN